MEKEKYPMLARMKEIEGQADICGQFLDFIMQKYTLYETAKKRDQIYVRADGSGDWINKEKLLADFFGIDMKEAEKEKQALLAAARKQKEEAGPVPQGHPVVRCYDITFYSDHDPVTIRSAVHPPSSAAVEQFLDKAGEWSPVNKITPGNSYRMVCPDGMVEPEKGKANATFIEYCYRNKKQEAYWRHAVVAGAVDEEAREKIANALRGYLYFRPCLVGLPGTGTLWHEIDVANGMYPIAGLHICGDAEIPTVDLTIAELAEKFKEASLAGWGMKGMKDRKKEEQNG